MLSYVEFYRPKFFLLENVLGLGIVKYILRTLTSLGYVPFFPAQEKAPLLKISLKRYLDHARTAIKCASASCKPESTDHRNIVAESSSGVHVEAFLSPSFRFRRIISPGRRSGPYSSTRVLNSTMSRATRTGLIVARLYVPSPWTMSSPTNCIRSAAILLRLRLAAQV